MLEILSQAGVLSLLVIGTLAWGFARVLDGPSWSGQAILLVIVLIMLLSQFLLPPDAPFRQSVAGSLTLFAVLVVAAIPIIGYRAWLRRLRARQRGGEDEEKSDAIVDRVARVPEASTLARDLREAQGTDEDVFGLIRRDSAGRLVAGAAVRVAGPVMTLAPLWWEREEAGVDLIATAEAEARTRSLALIVAEAAQTQVADALRADGFTDDASGRGVWLLRKALA